MEEREVGARSRNQASHSHLHIMYLDAGTRLSCAHFILSAHENEAVSAVILARTPIMSHSRPALQASAAECATEREAEAGEAQIGVGGQLQRPSPLLDS
jgi:hypothetical protein